MFFCSINTTFRTSKLLALHLTIIILFITFSIIYLCGFFDAYKTFSYPQVDPHVLRQNSNLIEYLTQFKNRTKEYTNPPSGFVDFNRKISGYRQDEYGKISYEFPILGKRNSIFNCSLLPTNISSLVNLYGIQQQYVSRIDNKTVSINPLIPENILYKELNRGGWFFTDKSNWGLDYPKIVHSNAEFTFQIADHIYKELVAMKSDSILNRVQASLNFVQFIPYGRPNFDTQDWYYHEVAIPAESIILGYSDCDSKSILLAGILIHLIPKEDIILVECLVRSKDEKTDGAHMMVAVRGLNIVGESIKFNNSDYILIETTAPVVMGQSDWQKLDIQNIITL